MNVFPLVALTIDHDEHVCRVAQVGFLARGFLLDFVVVRYQPHVRPSGWLGLEQEIVGRLLVQAIVAQVVA